MEMVLDDVDDFIHSSERAEELVQLDTVLCRALLGISRTLWRGRMWGGTDQAIIGYGVIVQPRPKAADVEWFLIGLAVQKKHLSVYVNAAEDGKYLVQQRAAQLGRVKVGAAVVSFPTLEHLNIDEFRALIVRAHELSPAVR